MSRGISADDLAEGSVAKLEIGTRVWERPQTDGRVCIEDGRVFDVVRVWNIKKRFLIISVADSSVRAYQWTNPSMSSILGSHTCSVGGLPWYGGRVDAKARSDL